MSGIITALYILFALVFAGGVFVVIYHLLTFRLNKSLAWLMTIFLIAGAVILLGINMFYFSKIDWQELFSSNNFL